MIVKIREVASAHFSEIDLSLADAQLSSPHSSPTNSSVPIKRACGEFVMCQAPHAATFLEVFLCFFFLSVGFP